MSIVMRLAVNAAALYAASRWVDGISFEGTALDMAGVALTFGVVNTVIKPVVKFFSFPAILLTLGLFTLVVNGLMLLLTARLAGGLGFAFTVRDFGAAFWGALCISVVSVLLGVFVKDGKKRKDD